MDLSMVSKITTKLRHFFIPHEGNNFEPHLFRYGTIATVLAVSVFVFAVVVFGRLYVDTSGLRATVISSVVADLANSERVKESLPLLTYNTTLQAAAQMKANDMSAKKLFRTHESGRVYTVVLVWQGRLSFLFCGRKSCR
jgi:magnesium-transporting ATPase (P-type)